MELKKIRLQGLGSNILGPPRGAIGRGRDEDGGDEGDEARSTFFGGRGHSYGRLAAKKPNGGSLLRRLPPPGVAV